MHVLNESAVQIVNVEPLAALGILPGPGEPLWFTNLAESKTVYVDFRGYQDLKRQPHASGHTSPTVP
jgi:hypothetical protein